jgi:SAM-dependent MidA family methyltransferase
MPASPVSNTEQTENMSAPDAEQESASHLAENLREKIRREGAISFRDWMETALYDERGGYYARRDLERWGRKGDYRTAPERSPLFAATLARYFAGLHDELGAPESWTIFEAGAGAGHFARGVLETLRRDHPRIFSATHYVIDEVSADGRRRASQRLKEFADCIEYRRLADISEPVDDGIVFANELLDAFPVHRVRLRAGKLFELCVGLDKEGRFVWVEREPGTPRLASYFARCGVELSEGQVAEVNLEIEEWMKTAASVFKRGYLILVDYGAEASKLYNASSRREGTLRAFSQHRFADDVLANPGEQDLTTTIDWTNVKRIGEQLGLKVVSFERQDEFLLRAGLLEQLEEMATTAENETEALVLRSSVRELILPGGMSESFQVLVQKRSFPRRFIPTLSL